MLKTIISFCLLAFSTAQALVQESALLHRWTFQDNSPNLFIDEVGGAGLRAYGTVHNVYRNTNGAVPGVRIGDAARTDSLGYLYANSSSLDLAGRQKLTVEILFSCILPEKATGAFRNVFTINADSSSGTSHGITLANYENDQKRFYMRFRDTGNEIEDSNCSVTADENVGSLMKAVFVNDSVGGTSAVYFNTLDDATVGTAETTTSSTINALNGYNMIVGNNLAYPGELHVVEIRIFGAALTADSLNANHTLDIAQYGTTTPMDVWVDSSVSAEGYGTFTSPLKTLAAAAKRVTRGSTIRFKKAGEYDGYQYNATAPTSSPSSYNDITLLGLEADPDGVVIVPDGAAETNYPLMLGAGSWSLRWLKFDADSSAGYCVYAHDNNVTSLTIDGCTFYDTPEGVGKGAGIMSRAVVTSVDSCYFNKIDEHGVYLNNYGATADGADYVGSSITNNLFDGCRHYAVQVNNQNDTLYTYNGLVIEHNRIINAVDAYSGGFYLGGTDSALVRFNTIDLSNVEDNGYGINFGGSGLEATGGDDGYIFNNEIIGVNDAIYGGAASNAAFYSHGMTVANNYITGATTAFNPTNAVGYHLKNCISYDCTTGIETDSLGCLDQEITAGLRNWGGYGPLPGLNGSSSGFYPVGVLSATAAAATPGDPVIGTNSVAGMRSPIEAFEFIRDSDLGTGFELNMQMIRPADAVNLDLWLNAAGQTGDGTASGSTWEAQAFDTLKVKRVF